MIKQGSYWGMVCQGIYFLVAIVSSFLPYFSGLFWWIISLIAALVSMLFYFASGLMNLCKRTLPFAILNMAMSIAGIFLLFTFGMTLVLVDQIIWNGYCVLLFVINLVFTIKKEQVSGS